MLLDPKKHVRRLAEFIARPFSEAEEELGVVDQIVELCSFQKLKNLEVNKANYKPNVFTDNYVSRKAFFRKGVVGDWRNHMSPEMAQKLDSIVNERFKGSGLEIPAESRST
ncbi:hypothetical protein LUZ60_002354 [Juncus effusus]|nr:hypothetical protein LUZ60_002354 [Juncus effusus]